VAVVPLVLDAEDVGHVAAGQEAGPVGGDPRPVAAVGPSDAGPLGLEPVVAGDPPLPLRCPQCSSLCANDSMTRTCVASDPPDVGRLAPRPDSRARMMSEATSTTDAILHRGVGLGLLILGFIGTFVVAAAGPGSGGGGHAGDTDRHVGAG
jgi:hypothetical protein